MTERDPCAIDPDLRIASVELGVGDLSRSVDFYERVLGLTLIERSQQRALLAANPAAEAALVLTELERPNPAPANSTGLFHVAWLHPSRASLAASVRRVAARWPIDGAADHGVSEALYLSDPDGLGIEIYADRPRESWDRPADGHGVKMLTLPLDRADLLAQYPGEAPSRIAPGTSIGHVHMKVSDLQRAAAFYGDELGFAEQARLPSAAFLSAGGYHHHIGLNSWESRGGSPPPQGAPGLRRVRFELTDARALDWLQRRAGAISSLTRGEDGELSLHDPDSQLLSFTHH